MGDKIVFQLGTRRFGLDIETVHRILEVERVFFIPGQSGFVNGMVSLMGEPVAVINCAKALNAPEDRDGNAAGARRIIVVREKGAMVGIDVNGALISFVWGEKIKDVHRPEKGMEAAHRFIRGILEAGQAPPVELIDCAAVFEETKKILSAQREHAC